MRKILFIMLWLVSATYNANADSLPYFLKSGFFQMEGTIKGYKPTDNNGFITIRTYSITGRSKDTAIAISAQGKFSCKLYQPFDGDIALMYNDGFIELYASQSEKIGLTIDEKKWTAEEYKRNAITYTGKSAAVSKIMLDYYYEKEHHTFINIPDMGNKEQGDKGFANISAARVKEEIQFLQEFAAKNKITNKTFIQWQKNNIIYEAAKYIAFYCFAGKYNESITYPELMKYLADFPLLNMEALNNSSYFSFLQMLSSDFEIITNINPLYKDTVKQKGYNSLTAYLDKVDAYSQGLAKQLMYYYLYISVTKDRAASMSRFTTTITEPYLKQLLLDADKKNATTFTSFNILERIKKQPGGDLLSKRLSAIAAQHTGKYIFMDFWGSWCGPCMSEMPLYPELIEKMKDKPVSFLFLAVETKEEKITETKSKYGINADFISLNDNETKILNNVLSFSSYPSHFIIDNKGNLVNNSITGIGSGGQLNMYAVDKIEKAITVK